MLLIAVLIVMAATLALVFQARLRMLPLALALAAAALAFGAVALVGGSLTMASVAALPVLIGLAVDYAIQFQARFEEGRAAGLAPADAAPTAAAAGGPTIASAGIATGVGFLVLLLSPVPMVRGFGVVLVLGHRASRSAVALTAGFAALSRFGARRRGGPRAPADVPPLFPRAREWVGAHGGRRAGASSAARPRVGAHRGGVLARAALLLASPPRLGGGHPDQGDLRRAPARAAEPPGAQGREPARGRHGRVRRARRDGARPRT